MVHQYVVDASVLIQGFIEDIDTRRVLTLLRGAIASEPTIELHIPEFCILECTNILWKRVRFHSSPEAEVKRSLENLVAFPVIIHQVIGLLPRALSLGVDQQLAVYDSLYIALSESTTYPLITVDERQANVARTIGSSTLKPITDFPEFTENPKEQS